MILILLSIFASYTAAFSTPVIENTGVQTAPQFIYTVCQSGCEKILKNEVSTIHPYLKFAFSRPGLITFKNSDPSINLSSLNLKSTFTRAYGISLGQAKTVEEIIDKAKTLQTTINKPLRLHVWGRNEVGAAAEHPAAIESAKQHVNSIRNQIKALCKDDNILIPEAEDTNNEDMVNSLKDMKIQLDMHYNDIARWNDIVLDVIVPTGPYLDEAYFVGYHIHHRTTHHSAYPGGNPRVLLPSLAPSRAYLKIQEAILWSSAPIQKKDVIVEIGSAPGGASYALLNHDCIVHGIDPCLTADRQHDPIVLKHPQFKHIPLKVASVRNEHLPPTIDWIICDANIAPQSLLPSLLMISKHAKSSLKGVFITVKLGEKNWGDLSILNKISQEIKKMGLVTMSSTQLPSNRQEILVYGLTALGKKRKIS